MRGSNIAIWRPHYDVLPLSSSLSKWPPSVQDHYDLITLRMGWSGGGAGLVTEGQETAALQSAAATAAKLEPKCCSITPACSRWLTFRIHTLCYYFILHYFRQSHNGACSSPNLVLGTRSQARLGDPLCPEQTGNVS